MDVRFAALVVFLVGMVQADVGWAREWLVERVTGTAWSIGSSSQRTELKAGASVEEGLTIATAANGRIRLSADNNVMTLGPGSVAAVRPKSFFSSKTEVQQQVGTIEFDVEKRASPHFTVQTPFMAVVVKGTAFSINVAKTDTRISVNRGLVQVRDLRSGETAGIAAGQRASVSTRSAGLQTAGPQAPAPSLGKPSAPSVAPVGQTLQGFRTTQAAEQARASVAVSRTTNAAVGVDVATRSFGFAASAPSADENRSSTASRSSGFGGFGGGLNGGGGDRSARDANAGANPEASAAAASERETRSADTASPSPNANGPDQGTEGRGPDRGDTSTGNPGRGPSGVGPGGAEPGSGGPGRGPNGQGPDRDGPGRGPDGVGPGSDGPGRGPDGKGPGGPGGGPDGKGQGADNPGRGPDGKGPGGDGPGPAGPGPGGDGRGPDDKGGAGDGPGHGPDKDKDKDKDKTRPGLGGIGRDIVNIGRDVVDGIGRGRGNSSDTGSRGGLSLGTK